MSARLLAVNAGWSLLSHILSRGTLMLAAIILARTLDTESFAAYSYFQITVSMLGAYTAMGLGVTASRFFAEVGHQKANTVALPLGTLWYISIVVAAAVFLIIMLTPNSWLNAGFVVPKWLLALGVFFVGLGVVPGGAILGLERYRQSSLISGSVGAFLLLGVWWASENGSLTAAIGVTVLSVLLQALGESAIVIRAVGWGNIAVGFRLRRQDIRRVLSLAGPMFFVTLFSASGSWLLGRIILQGNGGKHAFALYAIGLQWFSLGLLLPGILARVLLPRLVRNKASDVSSAMSKKLIIQGSIMSTGAAIVFVIFGALFGPQILMIYGPNYQPDRWFVSLFLGAAVLCAPANTVGNAIIANDGQKTWLVLMVLWLMVLLFSGAVAAPLGALAGAIALAAGAAVLTLTGIAVARANHLI